jgi:UDP-N-acetylglucosamine diphosphorylase/glucosamine-1-phosphate N-acetyltransferase
VLNSKFCAVILAAGKGTRMQSDLAKVLHVLEGKPLLHYSVRAARDAGAEQIIVVIGHQAHLVREEFKNSGCVFVEQKPQLGTGHAVMQAKEVLQGYTGLTVILCGDVPLLQPETIKSLIRNHIASRSAVTVLTTKPPDAGAYGRIVKNDRGEVLKIVEQRDATEAERNIREINTGIYCVNTPFLLAALMKINNSNSQQEYYLTDIVEIAQQEALKVTAYLTADYLEVMGINTPEDLAQAEVYLRNFEKNRV